MKLKDFYRTAIELGKEKDPRGEDEIKRILDEAKAEFEKLDEKEKEIFDKERLENPYPDTRILNGSGEEEIHSIMVGIDIEAPELLLFDRLREKGEKIDAAVAHHPEGIAYARLGDVMMMHADIAAKLGVPINVAEKFTVKRIKEVERRLMPMNHQRAVYIARLLKIPFMNIHTPADNFVASYLQEKFDSEKPRTLKDIIDILLEIPEYKISAQNGAPPKILIGGKNDRAGKVFVDMTGGTEGSKEILEKLSSAGVGTIVAMHMSDEHFKEIEKHNMNLVIAGHISSDSLGLNLLLDTIRKKEKIDILPVSGFIRVERNL
jgi:hypothetical protein